MKLFICNDCKHEYEREIIKPCPACNSSNVSMRPAPKIKLPPLMFITTQLAGWKAKGYKRVIANYSGYGDEGSMQVIQGITQEDGELHSEGSVDFPVRYGDPLTDAFEALAWVDVSGDNDGGGGYIKVDVETGKITRQEYYNVSSTEDLEEVEVTNGPPA